MTVFDGGILTAHQVTAIVLQRKEMRSYAFVPPERLHEFPVRRLRASVCRQLLPVSRTSDVGSALGQVVR